MTGNMSTGALRTKLLADPVLRDLMAIVELAVGPEIEAGFPKRRAAKVEIETTDGRRLEHFSPTRKGDPDNPLSDGELAGKFLELTRPVLGDAPAAALLEQLWRLDEVKDLAALPAFIPETAAGAAQ